MKISWRTFAFVGIAVAACAGVACSSSSSGGTTDAGTQGGGDSGVGKDGGVTDKDSGSTNQDSGGGTCTARQIAVDGGTEEISFDLDGGHACDDCLDQDCCTELGACYGDPACLGLQDNLQSCFGMADAGGCEEADFAEAGATVSGEYNGWVSCGTNHCGSVCPFQ